jgi:hypothetical protein
MGILDEAIREHLELKRQHGAQQSELQQIEDEAFGPPARPGDPGPGEETAAEAGPSEAPTQFMPAEEAPRVEEAPSAEEPPQLEQAPPVDEAPPAEPAPAPPAVEPPAPVEPESMGPAEEEHPAGEHRLAEEPAPPTGPPNTEERHAIAQEPTELHDVPGELAQEAGGAGEPSEVPAAEESPEETRYAFENEEFFDEKSLSDELDQALDAPEGAEAAPVEPVPGEESTETEPAPAEPAPAEPAPAEPAPAEREPEGEETRGAFFDQDSEDVLEETPEFLQDAPESDRLWFEQKPPKDFDFDD